MAILPDGINGPFIGRSGNRVFYILNGVNTSREIGKCGPQNDNQKATVTKLSLIAPFMSTVQNFVEAGFRNTKKSARQTAYSYAQSVNMKNAVTGSFPNQKIDYKLARFSEGSIAVPNTPAAKQNGSMLELSWKADLEGNNADESDQIMIMVYFTDERKSISVTSGAKRTEEFQSLQIPAFAKETKMIIHLSFVNQDRTDVSDNVFVTELTWTPQQ